MAYNRTNSKSFSRSALLVHGCGNPNQKWSAANWTNLLSVCFVKIWAVSDNGSTLALQVRGRGSIPLRSTKFNPSLAQLESALGYELRGWAFESLRTGQRNNAGEVFTVTR